MKQVLAITRKELHGYFGSPMALIFVGTFLAITLFSFFWVERFFARGIADVRPLFRWMPVLMILLVAALTMRQWSEEQRSGTLELLLTLPVPGYRLVLGKFLAELTLVALSLVLTLFLPITVAMLGNLDWGPVVGGYLAAILLAAAYAAIGLFVSSRTDNQIVALISTCLVCGFLYLLGDGGLADYAGQRLGDLFRALAPGSRFESIQRGVVDMRDLLYYVTLCGLFLSLNVLSLISKTWSHGSATLSRRRGTVFTSLLLAANLVLVNVWVYPLRGLRLDLTSGHEFTLSRTTRELLSSLQEPLLIRGYFSERTHPLLAPLVPTIRDTLEEYAVVSGGRVQLELIDPAKEPEKEAEANQTYGISPTPFQIAGRYESSIINSYFDVLIRYGDQSEVLSFQDLIQVESAGDGSVAVKLRNLEYDVTRSIKKVVYGFQSVDAALAALDEPARLTSYVTPGTLPSSLTGAPETVRKVATELQTGSAGKFSYSQVDPDSAGGGVSRQALYERYGLQPIATSLFSSQSYYLYLVLEVGDKSQVVAPSGTWSEAEVRTAVESALKRASPGFLKVVGLWTPSEEATTNMYGQQQQALSTWSQLRYFLAEEYEVQSVDLSSGIVPGNVDVLLIVAPQGLDDRARFAVDQYLMRGGAVVVAAGNYKLGLDYYGTSLALEEVTGGLREMLSSYGVDVEQQLVMDPQNEPFPVQVARNVSGMQIQEIRALNYPFYIDIRSDGMAGNHAIVSGLAALTLNWASPITIDEAKNSEREVTVLLSSTAGSWTTTDTKIQPDLEKYPQVGFAEGSDKKSYPLAVAIQGSFESYFKGKASPLAGTADAPADIAAGTIEVSPESARLVVLGSAAFLDDIVFQISASFSGDRYLNSLKLAQGAVSWSTEDLDLLTIRTRGMAVRVLKIVSERTQSLWEAGNYLIALLALVIIGAAWNVRRQTRRPLALEPPGAWSGSGQEVVR
jgi:ABC-2 type transport system permease protein